MEPLPFDIDEDDGGDDGSTLARSVLVVDDEWLVRDVFTRLLSRENDLTLVTAESAEVALRRLQDRRFDLMISDKNLPGMSGVELIGAARKLRPALEVIMITGYATAESLLAALAAGATDYVTKPFDDLKVVRAKIRSALERRASRVRAREASRALAKQAQALLDGGRPAKDQSWDELERQFNAYEAAIKGGGQGKVVVQGRPEAIAALRAAGFDAAGQGATGPLDGAPAVVVLDTSHPTWREDAEAISEKGEAEVLLLAGPEADLPELLDALALHYELVGFGQSSAERLSALPAKVRALMMQGAVRRAQAELSRALGAFQQAL